MRLFKTTLTFKARVCVLTRVRRQTDGFWAEEEDGEEEEEETGADFGQTEIS